MDLFNVYPLFDIEPVKAQNTTVWDSKGNGYLDLYGGHAVISIGHSHPTYIKYIKNQLDNIGFYSNSVQIPQQVELANKLGKLSGYDDYSFFFCNSGAEANENALKLASFHTGKKKVIAFSKGFHGRTSASVAVTDNPSIVAPINDDHQRVILPLNDLAALSTELQKEDCCAVIIEGIQGIGGILLPEPAFLTGAKTLCDKHGAILILDEIQSGYGRSGKFFAHQYTTVKPDLITVAKGMGNGFPMGGVLISPKFKASYGLLGTTFGGNHLACAAGLAVLDVIEKENLIENALRIGEYFISELNKIEKIKEVRGKGLMIGVEFEEPIKDYRNKLLFEHKIFTGVSGSNVIRLLPPLTLKKEEADFFVERLKQVIS